MLHQIAKGRLAQKRLKTSVRTLEFDHLGIRLFGQAAVLIIGIIVR